MHIGKILLAWLVIAIIAIVGLLASGIVKVEVHIEKDDDDGPQSSKHRKKK